MAETTVALGKGAKRGKYGVTPDQILGAAARSALKYGLGEEGARVVQAILKTEGGLTGDTGDVEGGGSYGPTQLYWQGQLGNLANDLGVSLREAANWVQTHPVEAVDWSLKTYLGGAIKRGLQAGLSGSALATFAQKHGQVSVSPERAGQVYQTLFGTGGGLLGASVAEAADDERPPIRVYRSGSSEEIDPNTPGLESQVKGGAPVTQAQQQAPPQTRGAEILQQIVNKKGKQPVSVVPQDPKIKGPNPAASMDSPDWEPGAPATVETANPSPTYRYLWDDGTYLDVKATAKPGGAPGEAEKYEVVGGTALASVAREDKAVGGQIIGGNSPSEQWIVVVKPDGTIEQKPNPNYVPPKPEKPAAARVVPTAANEPYIVREMPDGSITREPNPNYVPPKPDKPDRPTIASSAGPYIVQQMPDGSIQTVPNPNYQAPRPTGHVTGNRVITLSPDGEMTGSQVIDPEAQRLAEEKARRDLMGQQQLLVQNHFALLEDLHTKVATGAMTPEEADHYITQSKAYTDAALQGTTPFQIAKQAEDAARMARQQGIDVLNQRLSTGGSLANSLLSAATGIVNGGALPVPGHGPYGIDPLGYAKSFLNDPDVGGGPEVSDFAKKLLLGSRPLPAGL